MSNMKIEAMIAGSHAEQKRAFDHDLALAVAMIEDELVKTTNHINELKDRVRRLEQGGGPPG